MGKLEEFPSQPGKYLLRMVLTDEKYMHYILCMVLTEFPSHEDLIKKNMLTM